MKMEADFSPARPAAWVLLALALAACSPMGARDGRPGGGVDRDSGMRGPGSRANDGRAGGLSGRQMMVDQLQAQLRDTAQELDLTPRQLVIWERYQEKVGALLADQMKIEPYRLPDQTAPQAIGAKVDTVRNRLAAMEDLAEAANQLYQSLDERQKKVADRRLPSTVPALYSGLSDRQSVPDREYSQENRREGRGSRGGMGGGFGGSAGRF